MAARDKKTGKVPPQPSFTKQEDPRMDNPPLVIMMIDHGIIDETEAKRFEEDYLKYRGKCKAMCKALIATDPTLTLVRGYYDCPIWGRETHWWTKRADGTIVDPAKDQFPSRGTGQYVEFDGMVECSECGKRIREKEAACIDGRYAFCSGECYARFLGVL